MLKRFKAKKRDILDRLAKPGADYTDASPKGSVDEGILELVAEINCIAGFVTTSSCAGRIAVYLEGTPKAASHLEPPNQDLNESDSQADHRVALSTGGKGGGRWLFTSHAPVDLERLSESGAVFKHLGVPPHVQSSYPASQTKTQFVHFKFEPMILHILAASAEQAQAALSAAMTAGFRESGITGLIDSKARPTPPMVAVRSSGLGLDSIIGFHSADPSTTVHQRIVPMVSEAYLRTLIQVANERFRENADRKLRFRVALIERAGPPSSPRHGTGVAAGPGYETAAARRERKRQEGLERRETSLAHAGSLDGSSERNGEAEHETGNENFGLDLLMESEGTPET